MTAPPTERKSLTRLIRDDVSQRVSRIQRSYTGPRGPAQARAQADLATLRGCDPADPTSHPEAWHIIQDQTPPEMSAAWGSRPDDPTPAESARHCALVLFAIHQQSRAQPVHVPGTTFSQAVRQLATRRAGSNEEFDASVRGRFDQAILASTWSGRAEHLRALVRLMRTEDIGFDYAGFASDLFRLSRPESARQVRMAWARGFYYRPAVSETDPSDTQTASPDKEGTLS